MEDRRQSSAFPGPERPCIAYEDDRLILVSKPSGMHCVPRKDEGEPGREPTLVDWMREQRPETAGAGFPRRPGTGDAANEGGLLNRLDADTSGLVLFARDPDAFALAQKAMGEGRIEKRYLAWCTRSSYGLPGSRPLLLPPESIAWPGAGRGEGKLRIRSYFRPFGPGRKRVACADPEAFDPRSGGAHAPRKEWTKELYESRAIALGAASGDVGLDAFAVGILRGFRHQIRAQLSWAGHPIAGDPLYGVPSYPRLYLHSAGVRVDDDAIGLAFEDGSALPFSVPLV